MQRATSGDRRAPGPVAALDLSPLGRQPLSERRRPPDVGRPDRRDDRGHPGVGRERATPAQARGHAGGDVLAHGLPVDPGAAGESPRT